MRFFFTPCELFCLNGFALIFIACSILLQGQRSLLLLLIALELLLFGIAFLFLGFGINIHLPVSKIVLFILLTLGGAESALGLTLLVLFFRQKTAIVLPTIYQLKA